MIQYHSGYHVQRGHGIGNFFASLFRTVAPVAKSFIKSNTGQALKNIAIETAADAAKDLISGKNLRETASSNLGKAKENITELMKRKIDDLKPSNQGQPRNKKKRKNKNNNKFNLFNE